jgi:hypothetical protein
MRNLPRDLRLSPATLVYGDTLAGFVRLESMTAWPSVATLAREGRCTSKSQPTIFRALADVLHWQLFTVAKAGGNGPRDTTVYKMNARVETVTRMVAGKEVKRQEVVWNPSAGTPLSVSSVTHLNRQEKGRVLRAKRITDENRSVSSMRVEPIKIEPINQEGRKEGALRASPPPDGSSDEGIKTRQVNQSSNIDQTPSEVRQASEVAIGEDETAQRPETTSDSAGVAKATTNVVPIKALEEPHPSAPKAQRDGTTRGADKGTRLATGWQPSATDLAYATDKGLPADIIPRTVEKFRNHYLSVPGSKGLSLDWSLTWNNWVLGDLERRDSHPSGAKGMTVLAPIDTDKAADPNDLWGIDAWCRSVGAAPTSEDEKAEYRKRVGGTTNWMLRGCYIDVIARNIAAAAGFRTGRKVDFSILLEWISMRGFSSREAVWEIEKLAQYYTSKGDPAKTLMAFHKAVCARAEAA